MLAFTLISPALYAQSPCSMVLKGGVFQDFAPTAFYMKKVLVRLLGRMGANLQLEIRRPGYVPTGNGELLLQVSPLGSSLRPLRMIDPGRAEKVNGISFSSHLDDARVSERMARHAAEILAVHGYRTDIEVVHDNTAAQRGAALLLWSETSTGCLLGADRAGKKGRSSERIAKDAANDLIEDLGSAATVDRYLADQLILFAALADGASEYLIPKATGHVTSNLWLVGKILKTSATLEGNRLRVEGAGFQRRGSA